MKVKITDIPAEGRELDFAAPFASLNQRVNAGRNPDKPKSASSPEYLFNSDAKAQMRLELHGSSVTVRGSAKATFEVACSRCAESLEQELSATIDLILKPHDASRKDNDEVEDLGFGFYNGQEVDCIDIVEEYLILELPYTVTCEAESVEECDKAQAAAQYYKSDDEEMGDDRFAIFKTLKINGNGTPQ